MADAAKIANVRDRSTARGMAAPFHFPRTSRKGGSA